MKVIDILSILNTDEFYFINNNTDECEIVRTYESNCIEAINTYHNARVIRITPAGNAVEIRYAD